MKLLSLCLVAVLMNIGSLATAQTDIARVWQCGIECPGGPIEFRLRISESNGRLKADVLNGKEEIPVPSVTFNEKQLIVDFEHYDSKITAAHDGEKLKGKWRKRRGKDEWVEMKFQASPEPGGSALTETDISDYFGKWLVRFGKSEDPAVAIFKKGSVGRSRVEGTFLTTTGDYRYLAGNSRKDFRLSCFDGAHAFLFTAKLQEDGTLKGDFWSSNTWHETWTAKRDANATLPDAFKQTVMQKETKLDAVAFPDLDGKMRKLTDPEFAGKARLIYVFGSWCPNLSLIHI